MEQSAQIGDQEVRQWTLIERWMHLMIRFKLTRLSFRSIMTHRKQSNKLQLIKDLILDTKGSRFRNKQIPASMSAVQTVNASSET